MLEYADFILPFELLFRDIKTNDLTTSQSRSIKSKLLNTPFTSYNFFLDTAFALYKLLTRQQFT